MSVEPKYQVQTPITLNLKSLNVLTFELLIVLTIDYEQGFKNDNLNIGKTFVVKRNNNANSLSYLSLLIKAQNKMKSFHTTD